MASTLLSNVNSRAQYQANLLTNTPNRVRVLVEDEQDIPMWYRILKANAPAYQFHIQPYSFDPNHHGKGKTNVLAQCNQFGKLYVGCIDSDYDWLLKDYTVNGPIIANNPYIFQTYAYSIENLAAIPDGMSDCMVECTLHYNDIIHNLDEMYRAFIRDVSRIVYEVLLWHLVFVKEKVSGINIIAGRNKILGKGIYDDILNDKNTDLQFKREAVLKRLEEKCEAMVSGCKTYRDLEQPRAQLESELRNGYDLTTENAYLYVRGHNLHEFIIHTFFNPIENILQQEHKHEICAHLTGKSINEGMEHYNSVSKSFAKQYLLRHSYTNPSCSPVIRRICGDIRATWT